MSAFGKKLWLGEGNLFMHLCPGCQGTHGIRVTDEDNAVFGWGFNYDPEKPTFWPSIKIAMQRRADFMNKDSPLVEQVLCHYFITNGMIVFCGDSEHSLAGQTVILPDCNA